MADGRQGRRPGHHAHGGQGQQRHREVHEMTPGKGLQAEHGQREDGQRGQQRSALAQHDHGESGQQERGRNGRPELEDPLAGPDRVDVGQGPVPQMRVRVPGRKAEAGCPHEHLALFGERPAAQAQLPGGGLQLGQRGRVAAQPGVPQGPQPGLGATQRVAHVVEFFPGRGDLLVQHGHSLCDGLLLRLGRG